MEVGVVVINAVGPERSLECRRKTELLGLCFVEAELDWCLDDELLGLSEDDLVDDAVVAFFENANEGEEMSFRGTCARA